MLGVNDTNEDRKDHVSLGWALLGFTKRALPELRRLDRVRAKQVYDRALRQAWRSGQMWWALGKVFAAIILLSWIITEQFNRPSWWQIIVHVTAMCFLLAAMNLSALPILRRWVRAELGTHCAWCDYDLRGSPDRCPECGRAVKRLEGKRHGSQGATGAGEEN